MEIYIFTVVLIFIIGAIELRLPHNETRTNVFAFFLYVFIVIQIGLRWETGTDWPPYLENFERINTYTDVLEYVLIGFEIGYSFFVLILKRQFDSYSVFLLIHAIIFYAIIFRTARKYSPYLFVSLMFFYATNLGYVGSNRQLLAVIICLWGLDFVFEKKPYKFMATIAFAFLFHTTAFIFGIYYFLNRNFKTSKVIVVLAISIILGFTSLPFFLFSNIGGVFGDVASLKTTAYLEGAKETLTDESLSVFGLLKRLLFFGLFTYNYSFLSKKLLYYKVLYNGYVFGLIIYFLFSSSFLILVNRGSLYFNIMECFLISCQFLVVRKNVDKVNFYVLLLILSIVFLYQAIAGYPELFDPYKGLLYNVNFRRIMY